MAQLAQVPAEIEFFILRADGMAEGPYVHAQLLEMLASKRISLQTRLRPVGHDSWIPAFKVLEGTPDLVLAPAAALAPAATSGASAVVPFHPHAPLASLIAGVVGLFAWMIPIIGFGLCTYGGYQGLKVFRSGSQDVRAMAGVVLCGLGTLLSVVNAIVGIWYVLLS